MTAPGSYTITFTARVKRGNLESPRAEVTRTLVVEEACESGEVGREGEGMRGQGRLLPNRWPPACIPCASRLPAV